MGGVAAVLAGVLVGEAGGVEGVDLLLCVERPVSKSSVSLVHMSVFCGKVSGRKPVQPSGDESV